MKGHQSKWIIDGGASEGLVSLKMIEEGFNRKSIAVEPLSDLKNGLHKTIEAAQKKKIVQCFDVVVKALEAVQKADVRWK